MHLHGAWSLNRYESPMSLKPALSDRYPSSRSPGITGIGAPSRANSRWAVGWNSSGAITSLSSPGKTITAPFTADHYNEITGQNWDGSYLKASDIDLSLPFEPVGKFQP